LLIRAIQRSKNKDDIMLTTAGIADADELVAALRQPKREGLVASARSKWSRDGSRYTEYARRACETTHSELSAIALVEQDRVVILGSWGWTRIPEEKALSDAICAHVAARPATLAIEDARRDPLFRSHTIVRALGIVSYLGVPVPPRDSIAWGTLCVINRCARAWARVEELALESLAIQLDRSRV